MCKSNLRQVGLGISIYADQFKVYPAAEFWWVQLEPFVGAKWPRNLDWQGVNRYGGSRDGVYACPSYSRFQGLFQPGGGDGQTFGSYGYNCWGFPGGPPDGPNWSGTMLGLGGEFTVPQNNDHLVTKQIRDAQVVNPSRMIEAGDAGLFPIILNDYSKGIIGRCVLERVVNDGSFYNALVLGSKNDEGISLAAIQQRHTGRWNVGFCDGHIEHLRSAEFIDKRSDDVLRRWNNDYQPHRITP